MIIAKKPRLLRNAHTLVAGRRAGADIKIIQHPAQLFAGPIDERLFLGRESGGCQRAQLAPVGIAGEQLPIHHTVPASSASRSVRDIEGSRRR